MFFLGEAINLSLETEKKFICKAYQRQIDGIHDCLSQQTIVVVLHVSLRGQKSTQKTNPSTARLKTYIFNKVENLKESNANLCSEVVQLRQFAGSMREDWGKGQSRSVTKYPIKYAEKYHMIANT